MIIHQNNPVLRWIVSSKTLQSAESLAPTVYEEYYQNFSISDFFDKFWTILTTMTPKMFGKGQQIVGLS